MTTGDGGLICSQQLPKNPQTLRARRWVGIDKDTWKSSQEYVILIHRVCIGFMKYVSWAISTI